MALYKILYNIYGTILTLIEFNLENNYSDLNDLLKKKDNVRFKDHNFIEEKTLKFCSLNYKVFKIIK